MERLKAFAVKRHAIGRRLNGQRLFGKGRVGEHDVALVALAERDGHAVNERDFRTLVRPLDYF